jgi:hypothetical protein
LLSFSFRECVLKVYLTDLAKRRQKHHAGRDLFEIRRRLKSRRSRQANSTEEEEKLNKGLRMLALASLAIGGIAVADDMGRGPDRRATVRTTTIVRTTAAETSLVGIALFDSGVRVVQVYGSPQEILAIGAGGATGPAGGAPGVPGAAGAAGGAGRGGGGGGGTAMEALWQRDWSLGNEARMRQDAPTAAGAAGGAAGGGGPAGPAGAGAPGGAGAGGAGGQQEALQYVRWVYHRGSSRYGFVLDRQNRVVQIEAIGMGDARVRTNRGIRFGSNFADVIRAYGDPDGYEIAGDTITVRYLATANVAFRLNRLQAGRPHVVTGIVVAGGRG